MDRLIGLLDLCKIAVLALPTSDEAVMARGGRSRFRGTGSRA